MTDIRSARAPAVSIITPVLNGLRFIEKSIRSVLEQTCPDSEHVIIDGGSSDGTRDVLARYHDLYPERVRYVSEPDRGGCEGFNKGCRMARGRIFGWLGSDDVYLPEAIERAVEHFEHHPDDFFIYGEAEFIDSRDRVIGRFATQDFTVESAVNNGACLAFPAAFYRRDVPERIGGFRIHDRACDHDWVIRAGKEFRFTRLPNTFCRLRVHPGSTSASRGELVYPRANFLINRRHGGSLLSPVCMRYYRSLLLRIPGAGPISRLLQAGTSPAGLPGNQRRIAVFGAALTGYRCMEDLLENGRVLSCFIDNHPPPGGTYCDIPVCTPELFVEKNQDSTDVVMIATAPSSPHAPAMIRQLRQLGLKKRIYVYRPAVRA